ncbi:MAG: hypothetical protein FJZ16_05920, partial [Candidatus Omnitrophica bacterium]|nr:hypothetical protein [Candidatus Omnitrophota bacterium]
FNHRVYAHTLVNIIKNNSAPLVIGLLGDWGSGKSTILNIFQNEIKDSHHIVYFNAWKYAKDSFRRQFLVETAKTLINDKEERKKFINELNTRFIKDLNIQIGSLKDLSKVLNNLKINAQYLVPLALVILLILIGMGVSFYYGITLSNNWALLGSFIALFPLKDLISDLMKNLLIGMFKVESDPQIIFPEQFQDKFIDLTKKADKEIIFIIDDIDRCPDEMIMEILDSAKTFFTYYNDKEPQFKKCYFILAMDDKAIVDILKEQRGNKYEAEQILKFVDASVKLSSLSHADLIEFSKAVATETNISEEAVQIGIYGGFDTPRKIKHFLNSFKVIYSICKQRKDEGVFNFDLEKGVSSLAKILVLQTAFPNEFEKLKEDSNLFKKWEEESQTVFRGGIIKDGPSINLNLLKFLWVTRFTQIIDLQAILHLKIPAYAINLKNYSELKEALLEGDLTKIQSLAKDYASDEQKDGIKELIRDILEQNPTKSFLANILTSSLEIYKLIDFGGNRKKEYAQIVITQLLQYHDVLNFDPDQTFNLVDILDNATIERPKLVELSIADLNRKPIPEYAAKLINILYKETENDPQMANRINGILETAIEKDPAWVIQILNLIKLPEGQEFNNIKNKIPSINLIANKLLSRIDEKEAESNLYNQIFDVACNFWDKSYAVLLSQKCQKIFSFWYQQSISSINESIKLGIKIVKTMPDWVSEKEAVPMIDYIWNLYERIKDINEKREILEAFSVVVFSAPSKDNYISSIAQQMVSFPPDNLDKFISFIEQYVEDEKWWDNVRTQCINSTLDMIQNRPDAGALDKFNVVYKRGEKKIEDNRVTNLLLNALRNEQYIEIWKNKIIEIAKDNDNLTNFIFNELKNSIKQRFSASHKEKALVLLDGICKERNKDDKKQDLGNFIFEIGKEVNDASLSSLGRKYLPTSKELLKDVFKTKLNTELQEICLKETTELFRFKDLITEFLNFQLELTDNSRISLIEAIIRLANSNNTSFVDFALNLLAKLETVPKEKLNDLGNTSGIIKDQKQKDSWQQLILKLKS